MAKNKGRTLRDSNIISTDADHDALHASVQQPDADPIEASPSPSRWSRLGHGRQIGAVAVILLLMLTVFGSGWRYLEESAAAEKAANAGRSPLNRSEPSLLSAVNPFVEPPSPTPTPQLSKEYIYAGSRMLAVEDANASAAPPADLAVWRPSTGYWYVLGGQGSAPTSVQWGAEGDKPVPGDFDGDGKTDFSVWRPSTGFWYVTHSSTGYTFEQFFGQSGDQLAQADYDGDGKTDKAVFRDQSPNGWWHVSRSSDGATSSYQFGVGTDIPAPADYDGDGKADYAVWRGGTIKTFYILRSSNNQLLTLPLPSPATDGTPVSADYDGDGKADAAIRSATTNNWFILPSAGGALQTVAWQLGSDKEVANDYDGDGKVDIAVWRESIGYWLIRQSSQIGQAGELRQTGWGAPGDIPVPAFYRR